MSKLLDVFQKKKVMSPCLWFMRQAGRYLPEYKEVRKRCGSFLDLCYNPELAAKVTLQPIERFGFDAAIIFSDILVIPHALGQKVSFVEGLGPQLSDINFDKDLHWDEFSHLLTPVYQAIGLVKEMLPKNTALIGFSGAPWTLALYMLEGGGSRDFAKAKTRAFSESDRFQTLLDLLVDSITEHLKSQLKAGADVLQIFDTWAGLCPATHFEKWVLHPTKNIIANIRRDYPDTPIIGFPKGVGPQLENYGSKTGVSGLSLDSATPLSWVRKNISKKLVLQGNLDPLLLVAGGESLHKGILEIHEELKDCSYIFNLGHGILPQTPIKNVEDCVKWVRALEATEQQSFSSI